MDTLRYRPMPGTIIHGTLVVSDLIAAFAAELEQCVSRNVDVPVNYAMLVDDARELGTFDDAPDEAAYELLTELFDALDYFAPDGHSFGAHEGDGSDYGFWPSED